MSGRCLSCNNKLTNVEMCRKQAETGEYLQLCNNCLRQVLEVVTMPLTGDVSFFTEEEVDVSTEE